MQNEAYISKGKGNKKKENKQKKNDGYLASWSID
jgi:hypothetical protein